MYRSIRMRAFTSLVFTVLAALMALPSMGAPRMSYRPNELIVTLRPGAGQGELAPLLAKYNGKVIDYLPSTNSYLVSIAGSSAVTPDPKVPSEGNASDSEAKAYIAGRRHNETSSAGPSAGCAAVDAVIANKAAICSSNPSIKSIKYNNVCYIADIPACEYYLPAAGNPFVNGQWGLHSLSVPEETVKSNHIYAPEAWNLQKGKKNVVVAVLDSGVRNRTVSTETLTRAPHPDLASRLIGGWNSVNGSGDASPSETGSGGFQAHGTHVAGIIAADVATNSKVAGLASGVSILPVRIFPDPVGEFEGTTDFYIARGIDYCRTWAATIDGAPAKVNVINMSIGGPAPMDLTETAIKNAVASGIVVVVAAGNHNSSDPTDVEYPGAYPECISVGATDIHDNIAVFSNYGPPMADHGISAPGQDIPSTAFMTEANWKLYDDVKTGQDENGNFHASMSGTSMASPHVAAAAALLVSQGARASDVRQFLFSSATRKPGLSYPNNTYGYGLMNVYDALLTASRGAEIVYPADGSTITTTTTKITVNLRHAYTADDDKMFKVYLDGKLLFGPSALSPKFTDWRSYYTVTDADAGKARLEFSEFVPAGSHTITVHADTDIPGITVPPIEVTSAFTVQPVVLSKGWHMFSIPYALRQPYEGKADYVSGAMVWALRYWPDSLLRDATFTVTSGAATGKTATILGNMQDSMLLDTNLAEYGFKAGDGFRFTGITPESWADTYKCALFRWSNADGPSGSYKRYSINVSGDRDPEASFLPPSVDSHVLVHPVSLDIAATAPAGLGYWLYIYDDGMPLPSVTGMPVNSEPYSIGLFNGWNMVGNPFTTQVKWADALFERNGELVACGTALSKGWIKDAIYRYDGNTGQYVSSRLSTAVLAPWESQWILVMPSGASRWPSADIKVIFPVPGS